MCCTSYRNIVIMVGTNNLKLNISDTEVKDLYRTLKTKITLIRKYNKRGQIYVCPVLPTKTHSINRRINMFNSFILDDLIQSDLNVNYVIGFIDFLDKSSNLLAPRLSKDDNLHLNGRGISILVRLIKGCIFRSRARNSMIKNPRKYSNVVRGGPPEPV